MSACLATDTVSAVRNHHHSQVLIMQSCNASCFFFHLLLTWGLMPVHQWCSGNWSLGRFWVQRQEPAQQNSPATIWSQSGCLSVSKALLLFIPRAAARHHTHDLNAERAKSLWRRTQRELGELLSPLGGFCFVAHCREQQERLCKKRTAAFACR